MEENLVSCNSAYASITDKAEVAYYYSDGRKIKIGGGSFTFTLQYKVMAGSESDIINSFKHAVDNIDHSAVIEKHNISDDKIKFIKDNSERVHVINDTNKPYSGVIQLINIITIIDCLFQTFVSPCSIYYSISAHDGVNTEYKTKVNLYEKGECVG